MEQKNTRSKESVQTMKQFFHKRTFLIIVTQNNIFFIENFILEYIINDNVLFQNDIYCCVLGMPPRLFIPNAESQQSVTESESENDEELEVESAPILIGQLRISESESRTPAQTHENSILENDSISPSLLTTEVLAASTPPGLTDTHRETDTPKLTNTQTLSDIARSTNNSRPTNTFRHTESIRHTHITRQTDTSEPTYLRQSTETTSHTETSISTDTLMHNVTPRRSDASPVHSNNLNSTSTEKASSSQRNEARCKAAMNMDPMGINLDRPKYPLYSNLATTPRNTDTSKNTSTPTPQVPTDNLHSTVAAEAPSPHSKEAQLEALKRDPMGINFDRPKYPSYAILAVRISSYTDWPAAMTQTPRDMALAGFFYAGYGDYTRCFFCGGGLRNWEAGDDPWVEHARWFKKCAFVRQNRGQEFIDLVQKRAAELDEQGNQEEMGNPQTNTAISDPNSAQAKEEKVMRSPAVTTIKEMGYSEEKIKAAIHTIKSRLPRGKHKVSAQEILEVIFELNQSESGTPVGQSERVSENPTNNTNQSDSVAENTTHHMSQSDPAPQGNQNAASAMDASNADQTSLDDHENRNSLQNPIFDELTSLKQENSSLKDQIICKICMEKNVSIAFLPCGHLACCEDCAPAMRKCPICREFVRGTVKTFLV